MNDGKGRCPAILQIGDDYGDNHSTVRCGLGDAHAGPHVETGRIAGNPFRISWEGDMRAVCEVCGGRTEESTLCKSLDCCKLLCPECVFKPVGRERRWEDDRCPGCPDPAEQLKDKEDRHGGKSGDAQGAGPAGAGR